MILHFLVKHIVLLTIIIKSSDAVSIAKERIVTDPLSITKNGAPLDYSYNETATRGEHTIYTSAPGCPKSVDGYPWVIFGKPPRCYVAGFQGPCSSDMKLLAVSNSKTGVCNCECHSQNNTKSHCLIEGQNNHVAYFPPTQQCYHLFTQGACKDDEWLVIDEKRDLPICEKRKCPIAESNDTFTFFDPKENQCETNGEFCKGDKNHEMYKVDEHWIPQCQPIIAFGISFGIGPNDCPQDQKFSSILKECIKPFNSVDIG